MKIMYVLDRPELGGGVKVVFQHAQLLHEYGYSITILGKGSKPDWVNFDGKYIDLELEKININSQDLVIATYFTTIPMAQDLALGPIVHFCQGYEGNLSHLANFKSDIEKVYHYPLPTLTVTPYLGNYLAQKFNRQFKVTPPVIDPLFYPSFRLKPRLNPWIIVSGIFEAEVKNIKVALEAVKKLKQMGQKCRLLRISVFPLSTAEQDILIPDRYLLRITPEIFARELRNCDLMLFSSLTIEGFGLPLLEAMVSKVPVVSSQIPSIEMMGKNQIICVPENDPSAFAQFAYKLLNNPFYWHKMRNQGYQASLRFKPDVVINELIEGLNWAYCQYNKNV